MISQQSWHWRYRPEDGIVEEALRGRPLAVALRLGGPASAPVGRRPAGDVAMGLGQPRERPGSRDDPVHVVAPAARREPASSGVGVGDGVGKPGGLLAGEVLPGGVILGSTVEGYYDAVTLGAGGLVGVNIGQITGTSTLSGQTVSVVGRCEYGVLKRDKSFLLKYYPKAVSGKPEDLEKKGQVQFPMIVGGIVPIINLKEVGNNELTLTTDILAKIYSEKIRRWNDKEIADLNPKVKLPDLPIIKIRRADGSGTTWNFTRFLSEANADWKKTYGFGQQVEWVGGAIGAKGNDGVANNVMQTNGSIGYVEYAFAKSNNLATAKMIGTDGKAVAPDLKSFQSTWPMVATSYIVMPKASADPAAAKIALDFFAYGYAHDADAEALDYVPLTAAQKSESKKAWSQVSTK